jgi:hypothetical protein
MKFGDLNAKMKKKIWKTFLKKIKTEIKISKIDVNNLNRKNINERQIRRYQRNKNIFLIDS